MATIYLLGRDTLKGAPMVKAVSLYTKLHSAPADALTQTAFETLYKAATTAPGDTPDEVFSLLKGQKIDDRRRLDVGDVIEIDGQFYLIRPDGFDELGGFTDGSGEEV